MQSARTKVDRLSGSVGQQCSYLLGVERGADLVVESERPPGVVRGVGQAVFRCHPRGRNAGVSRNGIRADVVALPAIDLVSFGVINRSREGCRCGYHRFVRPRWASLRSGFGRAGLCRVVLLV